MNRCLICLFMILFVCAGSQSLAQQGFHAFQGFKKPLFLPPATNHILTSAAPVLRLSPMKSAAFPLSKLPSNFYTLNMGYFCKKELQVEKSTRLPLKIRLGSVQYTDRLEGKP